MSQGCQDPASMYASCLFQTHVFCRNVTLKSLKVASGPALPETTWSCGLPEQTLLLDGALLEFWNAASPDSCVWWRTPHRFQRFRTKKDAERFFSWSAKTYFTGLEIYQCAFFCEWRPLGPHSTGNYPWVHFSLLSYHNPISRWWSWALIELNGNKVHLYERTHWHSLHCMLI